MVLIISDKHDVHADVVEEKLKKLNNNIFRFNLDVESLEKSIITYNEDIWYITQNGKTINMYEIKTVWFRRAFVELLLEEKDSKEPDFLLWKSEWNKILLGFYLSLSFKPTLCAIKPSYAAENKFSQYLIAKSVGFNMPTTITSNDKNMLKDFIKLHNNNVVLKLHHQDFYKIDNQYMGIYVNKISSEMFEGFSFEGENPITLQNYIEKSYEVRYTVVDNEHFCCKIDSQKSDITKIDWRRYDIPNTPHSILEPPQEIKDMVVQLMKELNLNFGALDFIVDENGKWYFLEINPMGQWLWIEDLTGLNISDAICNWLVNKNK